MPIRSEPIRQRLTGTLKAAATQLWKQFRTLRRALVHPGVPWYAKAVCGCAVAYVASPIQLIPNFIPVIGQLDDVLVLGLSLRLLKRWCPASVLQDCRRKMPLGKWRLKSSPGISIGDSTDSEQSLLRPAPPDNPRSRQNPAAWI